MPGRPEAHIVDTPEALASFLEQLATQPRIAFDLETTAIRPRWAEIVGFSLGWRDDEAWYLPVRAPAGEKHLDPVQTLNLLRPILEDPSIEKIGQNLKYDMIVLRNAGVELAGAAFDTMVASYLLDAGQRNHSLDDLAKRYLGRSKTPITDLIGTGKNQRRMDEVPVRRVADYCCDDAMFPLRLRPILAHDLARSQLESLFHDVEMPLVEVLVELEYNGIRVDCERLADLSRRFGEKLNALEEQVYELAGHPFKIASPKQLQQVLFDEQKLPVVSRTKTGPSTDADVLEELARVHPLPAVILEYRQYAKLKSTYVDALPQMVYPGTGRVHASFHQDVTATGRLSSSDPNLQNIPVRTEAGREIRSAFVAGEPGWLLLAADYSQIELRVLAHFSEDQRLLEAFGRDEDIHALVAAQIYGVALGEVTGAMRRQAKTVNFGVIYGQSPFGLSKQLGIPKEDAAKFIDAYFEGYPGVEKFFGGVLAECGGNGYVKTILGRRRAIRGVRPDAGRQRNLPERTAINTVIQGSAADLIKQAMIATHRRLRRDRLPARMLLQIHDELIFEVSPDAVATLATLVREEMAGVCRMLVPLRVDVKSGPNWADAQALGQ
jgi:DNA polymerase-1